MSVIYTISPDILGPIASAAAAAVATWWFTRYQRQAAAEDRAVVAAFMGGNDRWLADHQARFTRPEVITTPNGTRIVQTEHPEHLPALSDRPAEDEDEVGDEQPGEAMSYAGPRLIERLWDWLFGVVDDIRDRFKSDEQLDAENRQHTLVYDEAEMRSLGATDAELESLARGQVPVFERDTDEANDALYHAVGSSDGVRPWLWSWSEPPTDAEARVLEVEAWRAANPPTPELRFPAADAKLWREYDGTGDVWVETDDPARLNLISPKTGELTAEVWSRETVEENFGPLAPVNPTPEPEPVTIVHRDHRYRTPGETGTYPLVRVVGDKSAGRHRAEVVIPAQRDGGDDL